MRSSSLDPSYVAPVSAPSTRPPLTRNAKRAAEFGHGVDAVDVADAKDLLHFSNEAYRAAADVCRSSAEKSADASAKPQKHRKISDILGDPRSRLAPNVLAAGASAAAAAG